MKKRKRSRFGRGRTIFFLCSLALLLPLVSGALSRVAAQGADGDQDSFYKQLSVFSEVLSLVRRNYVEETSLDRLFAGAFEGTVDALDPLATYVPGNQVEAYRRVREIGSRHSGVHVARQRGITYVLTVEQGSPGDLAGLRAGDILSEVDGHSTRDLPLWRIETALAGQPGETLPVGLLRQGQSIDAELELSTFSPLAVRLEIRDEIPIIVVQSFDDMLPEALTALLAELESHDNLLIDLRGAVGGSGESAYRAAALFARGELGTLADRGEVVKRFSSAQEPLWAGRLVLLTNRSSQGAAEIFASILQQLAGAELVGQRTFGHAGRRAMVRLSNGAEVHFTDAFYTGPDGVKIDTGLAPAVVVNESSRRLSEADVPFDELMLQRAIERLRDEPAEEAA